MIVFAPNRSLLKIRLILALSRVNPVEKSQRKDVGTVRTCELSDPEVSMSVAHATREEKSIDSRSKQEKRPAHCSGREVLGYIFLIYDTSSKMCIWTSLLDICLATASFIMGC